MSPAHINSYIRKTQQMKTNICGHGFKRFCKDQYCRANAEEHRALFYELIAKAEKQIGGVVKVKVCDAQDFESTIPTFVRCFQGEQYLGDMSDDATDMPGVSVRPVEIPDVLCSARQRTICDVPWLPMGSMAVL